MSINTIYIFLCFTLLTQYIYILIALVSSAMYYFLSIVFKSKNEVVVVTINVTNSVFFHSDTCNCCVYFVAC
jgi:hypothetical protein